MTNRLQKTMQAQVSIIGTVKNVMYRAERINRAYALLSFSVELIELLDFQIAIKLEIVPFVMKFKNY